LRAMERRDKRKINDLRKEHIKHGKNLQGIEGVE